MKSKEKKLWMLFLFGIMALVGAIGIGSVPIALLDILKIVARKVIGNYPFCEVDPILESILWKIRLPRVLLAFLSGSGLAVSGAIMQSILRNPLASSYTLGVSSGAALGVGFAILFHITLFGFFTLPIFGLLFGLLTVFLTLGLAAKIDRNMQNNSVILTGMAFSLFANAMLSIIMTFAKENMEKIVFWQLGSFSLKDITYVYVLLPLLVLGFVIVMKYSGEMDIMTFGEEQAVTTGVDLKKVKWILLSICAIITGSIVSMVGVIGFIDLFTPHAARKIFGSRHRYVLPGSALLGGMFMVTCDLLARTIAAPIEIPVGAITSAIGAPFFVYLYYRRKN